MKLAGWVDFYYEVNSEGPMSPSRTYAMGSQPLKADLEACEPLRGKMSQDLFRFFWDLLMLREATHLTPFLLNLAGSN